MKLELLDIILIVLFFQLISLIPCCLLNGGNRKISNVLLAMFLLAKALCISNFLAFRLYEFFYKQWPHLFFLGASFTLLWGPLLYFYTKSMIDQKFQFNKKELIHFVPFLMHLTFFTLSYHRYDAETKRALLNGGIITENIAQGFVYLNVVLFLLYTFVAIYRVWNYRKDIKENFSKIDHIQLNWLWIVLLGFGLKGLLDTGYVFSVGHAHDVIWVYLSRIVLFLFVNVMMYHGFRHPAVFKGMVVKHHVRQTSLSQNSLTVYSKRLEKIMQTEKPYLKSDLTLLELADHLKIAPRSLSEVIHVAYAQNFYDYINGFRIKESQAMLTDKSTQFRTILEILYEVGFNSKSSFHTAFKKYTGMTPSQFRRMNIGQNP